MYWANSPTDETIPLLRDATAGRHFAYYDGALIDVATFLCDVQRVISQLRQQQYVVNTSENRYHFMVSFAAALCAGQTTLLPPSVARGAIDQVLAKYPDSYLLSDALTGDHPHPDVLLDAGGFGGTACGQYAAFNPVIKSSHTVAVLFTSGSTGDPKPQPMSWFKLVHSARQLDQLLSLQGARCNALIATVPGQHMFGFETSIMLPLQSTRPLWTGQSFYPADIKAAQESIDGKSVLITTPLHLRALVRANNSYLGLAMIVSATAPLNADLASAGEQRFDCCTFEIYGSSETGAIAMRHTCRESRWRLMNGVSLTPVDDGVWVDAPGLPAPAHLGDHITLGQPGYFELRGREQDLVKIAGKRQSLNYLNTMVQSIEGVDDAIVFLPPDTENNKELYLTRLTAMVVAHGKKPDEIADQLRYLIDPVFIPRPVYIVDKLPRNPSGKLPISAVTQLWNTLQGGRSVSQQC